MGEFFSGWRRKVGIVTLLMALVAMAGWVRGRTSFDYFGIHHDAFTETVLVSSRDGFVWAFYRRTRPRNPGSTIEWFTEPILATTELALDAKDLDDADSHINWLGFHFAKGEIRPKPNSGVFGVWIFPHLELAMPLTLISASLLVLSNPRPNKPQSPSKSIPESAS